MKKYFFFLGGIDAEMFRIKQILSEARTSFVVRDLSWGAKASDYGAAAFADVAGQGFTPVLIELAIDCTVPEGTVIVDHHNERSGEPASLLQVLDLLEMEPTRWDRVVAADDAGWFPGLQALGATSEEMREVRYLGRKVQGVTVEQELEASRALAAPVEKIGDIRVIRMTHSKTAPIGDALAIEALAEGMPIPAYLVLSGDGEVNFSGPGDIAQALHEKFVGGWAGGQGLGKVDGTAYWGGYPAHDEVLVFLAERC